MIKLYGSSAQGRFATWKPENISYSTAINPPGDTLSVERVLSQKEYEVKDHLGNVRLVFSDLKDTVAGSLHYKLDVRAVNNYYPFGMLMPDMSWQSSGYRYGFNGMEMDNDIKGTGNHISWGDFGYDPRLVRRIAPDLLSAKNPGVSSYSAMGNNPILHKELDGKDYAVYVDHSENVRKITVKAVYYVQEGKADDFNSAKSACEFWNNQSGKYQYKVGTGENTTYYDIEFEFIPLAVDNPKAQATIDRSQIVFEGAKKITSDGSSNIYQILPDEHKDFETDSEFTERNGFTKYGMIVNVKESRKDSETGAHEEGHASGFGHMDNTIMSEASNKNRGNTINSTIVGQILKNAGLGATTYPKEYQNKAKGNLQTPTAGEEPDGFREGVVIEKEK